MTSTLPIREPQPRESTAWVYQCSSCGLLHADDVVACDKCFGLVGRVPVREVGTSMVREAGVTR